MTWRFNETTLEKFFDDLRFDFGDKKNNIYCHNDYYFDKTGKILTVNIPGYSKDDIDVFFENRKLKIVFNDSKKEWVYTGLNWLEVESCKCANGQLIVKFKEKESSAKKIKIE